MRSPRGCPRSTCAGSTGGATELLSANGAAVADRRVDVVDLGGDVNRLKAVFQTEATNLGAGAPGRHDYLRDVAAGSTSLAEPGRRQPRSSRPSISSDGSAALFDAAFGDARGQAGQPLHARASAPSERTRAAGGARVAPERDRTRCRRPPTPASCPAPRRSARTVATSPSRRLPICSDASDDSRVERVYVRDLVTGRTILVSRASGADGASADSDSFARGHQRRRAQGRLHHRGGQRRRRRAARRLPGLRARPGRRTRPRWSSRADGAAGRPATSTAFALGISADGNSALVVDQRARSTRRPTTASSTSTCATCEPGPRRSSTATAAPSARCRPCRQAARRSTRTATASPGTRAARSPALPRTGRTASSCATCARR